MALSLMAINISSIWSTVQHLSKYDARSDPIILRYSPQSELWLQFLKNADRHENTPVLITGYNSTAKPLLIASLIEPRPNYMGASIRKFWNIMAPPPDYAPGSEKPFKPFIAPFVHHIFSADAYGVRQDILALLPYKGDIKQGIKDMDGKSRSEKFGQTPFCR